ncbi:MAG: agmatine deiminase family protein, partial [Phycisphaerae bacterium]|nr:agmatine deiminase family protein [Phycisphaerae bacterium]
MKRLLTIAKAKTVVNLMVLFAVVLFALPVNASAATRAELQAVLEANYPDGLPRYMTPEEQQWLDQQEALGLTVETAAGAQTPQPTGATWTPGEYEPLAGILVRWTTGSYYDTALRGLVAQASQSTTVWCFVESSSEQTAATSAFSAAGANMSNVQFITYNSDSIWIRDYGPRYFYVNSTHAIMDHTYNRSGRPNDDGLPAYLASYWSDTLYDLGITHGGGNFHCFSNGDAFVSTLILDENPSYTEAQMKQLFRDYFNVNLTIYPRLISNIDATGHIDMWFMPLGDNKVLISEFPTSGYPLSRASTEAAAADMAARGYTVYRVPAYNSTGEGGSGGTHYTYTNAVIANNRVIIPSYGGTHAADDATALSVFQSALPSHTIVQVDCSAIIPLAGAVHCIMKHVYTTTTPVPMVEVTSANGGEWWQSGTSHSVQWVASDDVAVTSVDLYYSTNKGSSWNPIATGLSNTGSYDWTVPSAESTECRIRAVAYDASANSRQDISDANFTISADEPPPPPDETVYTYSGITNPSGTHKAQDGEIDVTDTVIQTGAFGARRDSISGWNLWAEASTAEYAALVSSDNSRYTTADPGYGDNAAMLFEFYVNEDPEDVVQLDISVEVGRGATTDIGYAYLWNYNSNSYTTIGTQSGTTDAVISYSITSNPEDYINPSNGEVTVFVVNMDDSDTISVDQVTVTVYSQSSGVTVPNVVGMAQADANSAIISAGLTVGTITTECSNTVDAGDVISQDPTSGSSVPGGSAVDLVVSSGQPSVPDVTGTDEASAIAAINGTDNISYGSSTTECSDTVAAG